MKIYVGNLDFSLTDADIKAKFEECGNVVSVTIIKDRDTNRSKGFAFVEMTDTASGERAINQLNGAEFSGRKLIVSQAREREERAPRRTFGGNTGGGSSRFGGNSRNSGGGSSRW